MQVDTSCKVINNDTNIKDFEKKLHQLKKMKRNYTSRKRVQIQEEKGKICHSGKFQFIFNGFECIICTILLSQPSQHTRKTLWEKVENNENIA